MASPSRVAEAGPVAVEVPLLVIFFVSGFAGLVYQVLWLRELGLLFGSTAHAASMTLAIFFLGLATGSWLWGRAAEHLRRPLRTYAWLEVGIAVAALGYFPLLDVYHGIYRTLFAHLHESPPLFLATKALLATSMLLPAAILMGGTLPIVSQRLARHAGETATAATRLYACNTVGAACGALAAGFCLPHALGYRGTYVVAMCTNVAVAVGALALDRLAWAHRAPSGSVRRPVALPETAPSIGPQPAFVYSIALLSGFATLGLEVLWTRMFAQVLHNSVYSFAAILFVFLLSLGLGAALAHRLFRSTVHPDRMLVLLLTVAGTSVAVVPFVFYGITDGLSYVAVQADWSAYIIRVFATAAGVMLLPVLLMGTIFPYTLKLAQSFGWAPGVAVGRMAAVNTAGSIAGAVFAGFVMLPTLGLWASIKTIGLLYLAVAAVIVQMRRDVATGWRMAPVAGMFLFATVLDSAGLSVVRADPERNEVVYQTWEGAHGVVAVVRRGDDLRVKVDNYYSLGGTDAATYERTQADLPLVLHGNPRSVFFLGLGTGITAGAAVGHPVEGITVAELIPEVVEASRRYFGAHVNGLFDDPRVRVVPEDGRNYLLGADEAYDVVIADLFIPWQSGAASLYTSEHFAAVRARLRSGGLFAQWLPLYQLSRDEFFVIARTMVDAFPQVTLWRGDFDPGRPIVALIGHADSGALDVPALVEGFRRRKGDAGADRRGVMATTAMFYAGNVSADRKRYAGYEANTDDWPVIEYSAPITQREAHAGAGSWFVDGQLEEFYAETFANLPPRQDAFLAGLTDEEIGFVEGGRHLFAYKAFQRLGDPERAATHLDAYSARMPDFMTSPQGREADHETRNREEIDS